MGKEYEKVCAAEEDGTVQEEGKERDDDEENEEAHPGQKVTARSLVFIFSALLFHPVAASTETAAEERETPTNTQSLYASPWADL